MAEGLEGPLVSWTSKRNLFSLSLISFDLNKKFKLQPAEVEGPPPPDCCAIRDTWKYQVHRKILKYSKIFRNYSEVSLFENHCKIRLFSFDLAVKTWLVFAWTIDYPPFPTQRAQIRKPISLSQSVNGESIPWLHTFGKDKQRPSATLASVMQGKTGPLWGFWERGKKVFEGEEEEDRSQVCWLSLLPPYRLHSCCRLLLLLFEYVTSLKLYYKPTWQARQRLSWSHLEGREKKRESAADSPFLLLLLHCTAVTAV